MRRSGTKPESPPSELELGAVVGSGIVAGVGAGVVPAAIYEVGGCWRISLSYRNEGITNQFVLARTTRQNPSRMLPMKFLTQWPGKGNYTHSRDSSCLRKVLAIFISMDFVVI